MPVKYNDPRNPVVTIQIQGCNFPNNLVDLGETINILTHETCGILCITTLKPTLTSLELDNRSVVKLEGTLEHIIIFVDSWNTRYTFLLLVQGISCMGTL